MDRPTATKPYKCKAYSLGYPPRADLDHALDLAEHLEFEEIVRKLSVNLHPLCGWRFTQPPAVIIVPTGRHWSILKGLLFPLEQPPI